MGRKIAARKKELQSHRLTDLSTDTPSHRDTRTHLKVTRNENKQVHAGVTEPFNRESKRQTVKLTTILKNKCKDAIKQYEMKRIRIHFA